MTETDSSAATGEFVGTPWDFIVRIEPLGSQPTLGLGILVNERVVLTTGAVLPEAGPPFVAVAVVSSAASVQAEPIQRVASPSGDVVVLRLLEPLPRSEPAPQFAQPSEEDRFETVGGDGQRDLSLLGGLLRLGPDAELRLEFADRGTALAGAPVLVDGRVVGIVTSAGGPRGDVRAVAWTSVAGELAEYAPEIRDAVWPVGPLDNQGPVQGTDLAAALADELSPEALRVLGWYDAVQAENGDALPASSALWTAVVLDARAFPNQVFAALVPQHLERATGPAAKTPSKQVPDLAQSARDWFGIRALPREPTPSDAVRLGELRPILAQATVLRDATQPREPIHLRHLLAALVAVWPEGLEQAGGDAAAFRGELLAAVAERAPDDDQEAWRGIFSTNAEGAASDAAAGPALRRLAGYSADVVGQPGSLTDELNVAADVETLCDVLAAKDALPPVSVGLFGRWGSGKSYFMALMQERMIRLAEAAEAANAAGQKSAYCSDITQITFNAWHYMDANLWATLAVRLFEGLSTTDEEGAKDRDEADVLRAELSDREKQLTPMDVKIGEALGDPRLEAAAKEFGVEGNRSELFGLAGEVTQFRRYARGVRLALFGPHGWKPRHPVLMAVTAFVVIVLVVLSVLALTNDTVRDGLVAVWGVIVVVLGTGLGRIVGRIRRALAAVNGALGKAGIKPADVTKEREAADQRLVEIKERLAEIDRRQSLYDFVLERAGSADYRSHFGLISVVRGDLESLAHKLAAHEPDRRLVLYIDDLDRCPPSRVVEVLQAVHLLLAFPLFVVVVGVDPRWLLRSLQRHYKEVLSSDHGEDGEFGSDDDRFWESTPQNYLEKIFQIPFALRPMSPGGFGRLVDQLTSSAVSAPGSRGNGQQRGSSDAADPPDPPAAPDTNVARPAGVSAPTGPAADDQASLARDPRPARPGPSPVADRPVPSAPRIDANPAALLIDPEELEFLKGLAELVGTPRETKRLVNLYRLVRASLPADAIEPFLHDRAYEPLLTLLAVLVGFPRQAQALFRGLRLVESGAAPEPVAEQVGDSWTQFVALLAPAAIEIPKTSSSETWTNWIDHSISAHEAAEWAALASALEQVAARPGVVDAVGFYRGWVDVVERYLFDTALAQVTRAPRPPDEPASTDGV